jgi:uncharacterized membrane-anchored protein
MSPRIVPVLFVLTCVAQLAYPASMIVGQERTLRAGAPVRVRCQAVDPSDLLRGRYVRLRLETFTIPVERPEAFQGGQSIHALLEPDAEGFARLTAIRDQAPETGLHVSGEVRAVNPETREVTVGLPFDRYYMDEYDALRAEAALRSGAGQGDAFVVLRVRKGRAAIEDLFVGGRPIAEVLSDQTPR